MDRDLRYLLILAVSLGLSACTASGSQKPEINGHQESLRTAIARLTLQTPEFGSISVIKAKIINARISAPVQKQDPFSGEAYTSYCIQGAIENPLFPIHQAAYAEAEVKGHDGQRRIQIRSSKMACGGSGFEPFPEIEELSIARYAS
jgi:hypothetical protein